MTSIMQRNLWVVLSCLLATCSAEFPLPESSYVQSRADGSDYRLPTHVVPVHYELTLEPLFDSFTFNGVASIEVEVTEEANNITLHANQLTITTVTVRNSSSEIEVASVSNDTSTQFLIVELASNASTGVYYLDITYVGELNSNNRGFYRGNYQNESGDTRWFATTKFEPVYARQAFPCFDEPALKAQFTIHVIRSSDYMAISNMNLNTSTSLNDGKVQDTFERSVKMSTYLVAFIVSDFGNVTNGTHSTYAQKQLIDEGRGDYSLEVSVEALQAIEDFTNVSYSIDKMYQVGLPDDWFPSGAMENWGIVTYKERYLLFKENVTSSSEKQTITTIISHEYGHQWFGNLVTPTWWKYIWLNEGFATYLEYFAASIVQPTWRLTEQWVIKSVQYAFESDSLTSTRPMSTDAGSPTEISSLFDYVIYDKAGSVIRMMEHFLTTPIFRAGLTVYLNNRSFDAATPTDLWNSMQEAVNAANETISLPANATVESVMETWNSQSGYPVLYVERNYSTGTLNISQSRFLLYNASYDSEEIFYVPINYATADNPDFTDTSASLWLTDKSLSFDISLNPDSWLIVNKQQTGYYRVNYDETNWVLIAAYLKSGNYTNINAINRAQIIDDAFTLARSGRLQYDIVLKVFEYLSNETDYVPLYSFSRGLTYLDRLLASHEYYDKLQSFVINALQGTYDSLGTDLIADELPTDVYNRINIIKWMCLYGGGNCREALTQKLSAEEFVHPDLQAPVYCGGMRNGNSSNWEFLFKKYVNGSIESLEKSRVLSALGCSLNRDILIRFLNISLGLDSNNELDSSLGSSVFSAVYSASNFGVQVAFDYFQENFATITSRFSSSVISSILSGLSLRLTTSEQLEQLQAFINSLTEEVQTTHASAFTTAISNIESNLVWYSRSIESISLYFDATDNSTTTTTVTTTTTAPITATSSTTVNTTTTTTAATTSGSSITTASTDATTEQTGAGHSLKYSTILLLLCLYLIMKQ